MLQEYLIFVPYRFTVVNVVIQITVGVILNRLLTSYENLILR